MDEVRQFQLEMRYSLGNPHIWLPVASSDPGTGRERVFAPESRMRMNDFQVGRKGHERKNIRDFFQALRLLEDMELGLLAGDNKARWRDGSSGSLVTRRTWRKFKKTDLRLPSPISLVVRSLDVPENESTELALLAEILSTNLPETEKEALAKSRIGQGAYRKGVENIFGGKCAITGSTSLLTASHIKPWRDCNHAERLDPYNGLLLSPLYDKAFDSGLITFDTHGAIIVSEYFIKDATLLDIDTGAKISLLPEQQKYMMIHRAEYFRGEKI
jgi:hypothetical protein